MDDWIEQLERLAQLRDRGLLTDEEFADQKRRLLELQTTPQQIDPVSEPAPYQPVAHDPAAYEADEQGSSRLPWIIAALALLLAVSAAAWFGSGLLPRKADPALADADAAPPPMPTAPVTATPTPTPTPTPAQVPLDRYLTYSDPGECIADKALEGLYQRLDGAMAAGEGSSSVRVVGLADPLPVASATKGDDDGAPIFAEASVRFPDGSSWNGLTLSRIKAERISPPETDSTYIRSILFKNTVAEVRAAMRKAGLPDAQGPAFRELRDTYASCGGAGYVEAVPGGAALVCSWGC